jgi:hypothetical protein
MGGYGNLDTSYDVALFSSHAGVSRGAASRCTAVKSFSVASVHEADADVDVHGI